MSAEEQATQLRRLIDENKRRIASSRLLTAELREKELKPSRQDERNSDGPGG